MTEILLLKNAHHIQLATLYDAYITELSTYGEGYVRDANGTWQPDLLPFWTSDAPGVNAYLISHQKVNVGFGFVGSGEFAYKPDTVDHKLCEFFLNPPYRGMGIAEDAAKAIFQKHRGLWELAVLHENKRALRFWSRQLALYTPELIEKDAENIFSFSIS